MRVLLADDSEELARRLLAQLRAIKGIEIVGQARSAGEAAQAVRDLQPDVLILDIAMPGGSGIRVLEGMRGECASPLVIVLTNYRYPQYRKRCFELGARFFFDKSTDFKKVGEVLRGLMDGALG